MHLLKMPEICKQSDLADVDVLFEIKRTDIEHMVWHRAWMHASSSSRGEESGGPHVYLIVPKCCFCTNNFHI